MKKLPHLFLVVVQDGHLKWPDGSTHLSGAAVRLCTTQQDKSSPHTRPHSRLHPPHQREMSPTSVHPLLPPFHDDTYNETK